MVTLAQLWLPIVLAAVLVFVASSLIHMVFKWHNSDYHGFKNEDDVRAVIRAGHPAPGQYVIPYCADMKEMQSPEMMKKFTEGPMGFLTLRRPGAPSMGKPLGLWFALNLVVALLAGYIACHSVPAGAGFSNVCRIVCTVTFMAYAGGSVSNAIWMGKTWPSAAKEILDALIFGVVSAAAFAFLWPAA